MKKAIITGADGFIGRNLTKALLNNNYRVYAIVLDKNTAINVMGKNPMLTYIECSMNDYSFLKELQILKDAQLLFHLAWAGVSDEKSLDYSTQLNNVICSCDLQTAASELNVKRFVFADSIMEFEHEKAFDNGYYNVPLRNTYHVSKIATRNLLQIRCINMGMEFIPVLLSNVYGIGENSPRLINTLIRKLIKQEHMSLTSGEQLYDFIYISDAAEAILLASEKGNNNKMYYIGNSKQKPLKEYLYQIRNIVAPQMELGIGENEFNGISLDYTEFDTDALFKDTHFIPKITFEEGIKLTYNWIKTNYDNII